MGTRRLRLTNGGKSNARRSEGYNIKAGGGLEQYSWRYQPLVKCGPRMEDAGEPIVKRNIGLRRNKLDDDYDYNYKNYNHDYSWQKSIAWQADCTRTSLGVHWKVEGGSVRAPASPGE